MSHFLANTIILGWSELAWGGGGSAWLEFLGKIHTMGE